MASHLTNSSDKKVIFIGVGGATCSGKTTLAKHLNGILPNSFILHQDDFAPPEELVPIHPIYTIKDWDDPDGAIDWPRLQSTLDQIRNTGSLPDGFYGHDHMNIQKPVPLKPEIERKRREELAQLIEGKQIIFVIVDGFLLYWDEVVTSRLDVRLFLRTDKATLEERRSDRNGYITAGSLWKDPPGYFSQIVWPAYVKAHGSFFDGRDVENGKLRKEKAGMLEVIDTRKMDEIFEQSCDSIAACLKKK